MKLIFYASLIFAVLLSGCAFFPKPKARPELPTVDTAALSVQLDELSKSLEGLKHDAVKRKEIAAKMQAIIDELEKLK